jgi:hypothetical protein
MQPRQTRFSRRPRSRHYVNFKRLQNNLASRATASGCGDGRLAVWMPPSIQQGDVMARCAHGARLGGRRA